MKEQEREQERNEEGGTLEELTDENKNSNNSNSSNNGNKGGDNDGDNDGEYTTTTTTTTAGTTTNKKIKQTSHNDHNDFNFNDFTITLVARSNWSNEHTRQKLSLILCKKEYSSDSERTFHERLVSSFLEKCTYTCASTYSPEIMSQILGGKEDNFHNRRNIVYFALPPKQYLRPLQAMLDLRNVREKNVISSKSIENKNGNNGNKENMENKEKESNGNDGKNRNENKNENRKENENINNKINMNSMLDLILEKPIGYDIHTANEILGIALDCVGGDVDKIWCVDHYVAKDLVTSIMPLKTCKIPVLSRLFDDYFNSDYISAVDVVFSDTGILDGRSGYFDDCGIIRDIITNHLIQLLALICADVKDANGASLLLESTDKTPHNDSSNSSANNNNTPHNTQRNTPHTPHNTPHTPPDVDWSVLSEGERSTLISSLRARVLQSIPPVDHKDFTVRDNSSLCVCLSIYLCVCVPVCLGVCGY